MGRWHFPRKRRESRTKAMPTARACHMRRALAPRCSGPARNFSSASSVAGSGQPRGQRCHDRPAPCGGTAQPAADFVDRPAATHAKARFCVDAAQVDAGAFNANWRHGCDNFTHRQTIRSAWRPENQEAGRSSHHLARRPEQRIAEPHRVPRARLFWQRLGVIRAPRRRQWPTRRAGYLAARTMRRAVPQL